MTELASVTKHHLALTCSRCGHSAQVAVTSLIERFGRDMDVRDAARRARCSRCHIKGQNTFSIIYIGGSRDAMLGAGVK